jgi:hypothetical protein
VIDERLILHRYKSSSFAGTACALMVIGLFAWNYYGRGVLRTDLLAIATVTAVIKIGFMAWYRFRD